MSRISAPSSFSYHDFGDLIRELRTSKGLSLKGLADHSKGSISRHTIWLIEQGKQGVSLEQLASLSEGLGMSYVDILHLYENRASNLRAVKNSVSFHSDDADFNIVMK